MTRPGIMSRLDSKLRERRRRARFTASVSHVHGPDVLDVAEDEVVLIALVRNGSYYLDAFFDYYRGMGVKHFVFFDNGSTDDTLDRISAQPGTIIDRSELPLTEYEDLMRQYPAQKYADERWCLYVDMDEMLDFEGRETIGISGLIAYLREQDATAFAAQMLEMFPKASLADVAEVRFADALEQFSYYDITAVRRVGYHAPDIEFGALLQGNLLANPALEFFFGGVRGKVFGENCCLTKHPLIFNGAGVTPAPHPHLSMGVRVADVTGVIKHYKFTNNLIARDAASQQSGDLGHGEDSARHNVLSGQPDVSLWSPDAKAWQHLGPLYDADFLLRSDRYSAFVARRAG